jgi:uncharacterized membrane protein YGL010W
LAMGYSALYGLQMPYSNLLVANHKELRRFFLHCLAVPALLVAAIVLVPRFGATGLIGALVVGVAALLAGCALSMRGLVAFFQLGVTLQAVLPPILSTAVALSAARLFGLPWAASAILNVSILLAFLAATRQLPLLSLSQEITRE